ncbi:DNA repair protein RecN [Paracrocinitomix mangrovi]|uniref:DNA repair protein RecN n=1 Tax=Paracrocinitomix mangrovi TaxID=2862509 RepID=UPI001C8DF3FB|nr:DNA repair protein RecN [Paracrocinitomix mangrovi]UKN01272.1 DNA repair protein RecN [Paracrocinitomix mangrovi]
MLNRLEISNYALIENVNIQFNKGFSTITGETGAGKSILLKALGLLMGERADTTVLKQSEKKCFLEAEFDISKLGLKSFFEENELDYESTCIIRREFSPSGKSRGFINDSPVQMTQMKELGNQLITIHSQHQTLELFGQDFQMDVVDALAGNQEDIAVYRQEFKLYRQKVNEQIELKVKEMENRKEKDYVEFLVNELKMADLDNVNLQDLQSQSDKIENAEQINEQLSLAKSVLENESFGPQVGIKTILEAFESLKDFDKRFGEIHSRLLSLKIELDDLANEIDNTDNDVDFGDGEAQEIKEKMELLNSLTFKHNLSEVTELKELRDKLEGQLSDIGSVEDKIAQLEIEINQHKTSLAKQAENISKKRKAAAPVICESVHKTLAELGMEHAELDIVFEKLERLSINGTDGIVFNFKTNKGGQFLPIKKIASGGELSRLMLAILSLLSSHKNLPTIIFDEIDTGVSGEVAAKIAAEFVKMGNKIQLIAITHLPQVAAKGNTHYHVQKEVIGDKTTTAVVQLNQEERINELAKMISGEQITDAAMQNAQQLLKIS